MKYIVRTISLISFLSIQYCAVLYAVHRTPVTDNNQSYFTMHDIEVNDIATIKEAISKKANINGYFLNGVGRGGEQLYSEYAPIHYATVLGKSDIVKILISSGADPKLQTNSQDKVTALQIVDFYLKEVQDASKERREEWKKIQAILKKCPLATSCSGKDVNSL
ncbi:hypothetical protein AB3N58_01940 [Leptospira sp. WS60.C2]